MIRTYSELIKLPTFEERFEYLKLGGQIGSVTFGDERYLNQVFYQRSREWKSVRMRVIARDMGCDLGVDGYELGSKLAIVHHMNPIDPKALVTGDLSDILNPEYLITVSHDTHNAIHYGTECPIQLECVERTPGDTCPWK